MTTGTLSLLVTLKMRIPHERLAAALSGASQIYGENSGRSPRENSMKLKQRALS